jgi:hypothetical protein
MTIESIAQSIGQIENIAETWSLTDAVGRHSPDISNAIEKRERKLVGMFYWTWHVGHMTRYEPINISKAIEAYPEAVNDFNHKVWTRKGRHNWGESLFGYYKSVDRWVLRQHAEMLADAGVDVVFFDATNPPWIWEEAFMALGEVWTEARKDGIRAPDFVFMTPFTPHVESKEMITKLYNEIYASGLFKDLWFLWEGKPLIMGYPDNVNDAVKSFFTFRPGQGSYLTGSTREDHWGWLENFPQHGFVEDKSGNIEQVTVGVAQNATDFLSPAAMNDTNQVYGRSYTQKEGVNNREGAVNYGYNFQEQWDRAIELDPELIFVTGWNEWVMGRYEEWQGTENAFPDQFTQEYSRDIEPMKGGHGDNYYCQLVSNIRRFKGLSKSRIVSGPKNINIDGAFDDWQDVFPIFRDHKNSIAKRDANGYGSTRYINETLENDIIQSKVSRDNKNLYFNVSTVSDISVPSDQWMMLLIDIDRNKETGWEGYDFVINRTRPVDGKAVLEKCVLGWKWKAVGKIDFAMRDNQMELKIPKSILNSEVGDRSFEFKWWDNISGQVNDGMDFYINGDTAPSGRFNYVY